MLQGPTQFNADVSLSRKLKLSEAKSIELRCDAFNLLNTVNFANPVSNFNAVVQAGIPLDPNSGQIVGENAGDFGRVISTSNNPRIVQLAIRFNF